MDPSDIDPLRTMIEIQEIAADLANNNLPGKMLPLDIHIIDQSTFIELIRRIPAYISETFVDGKVPFLPIHPLSLRKVWQYDDQPYNFVQDFLFSLIPLQLEQALEQELMMARRQIVLALSTCQLVELLYLVAPATLQRRLDTPELLARYQERIQLWP